MCGVWRGYDVAGEFTLRLVLCQRVAPPYWRSDTHTHTHTRQSNSTRAVADVCHQLLDFDYVAIHPNAGIWYKACDMVLAIHTDASYLSKPGMKSQAASHFYLSNRNDKDFNNGAILTLSTIIKHVVLSASEAELAMLYYGCKLATPL
jgi:hypothetical protein